MELVTCPRSGVTVARQADGNCPCCGGCLTDAPVIASSEAPDIDSFKPTYKPRENRSVHQVELLEDPIREFSQIVHKVSARFFCITCFLSLESVCIIGVGERVAADADRRLREMDDLSSIYNATVDWRLEEWARFEPVFNAILWGTGASWSVQVSLFWLGLWWNAFAPRRITDVFYLRSFRNDNRSWAIRVAIQEAIGPTHRLSGIRDPRRRGESSKDGFLPLTVAMKYTTPRYMDLEAGEDWRPRLWNSLQNATAAVVDVSDMTTHVEDELQLATKAVGAERVVVVAMQPATESSLRPQLAQVLDEDRASRFKIVVWPSSVAKVTRRGRREFMQQFRSVFAQVAQAPRVGSSLPPVEYGPVRWSPSRKAIRLFWGIVTMQAAILMVHVSAAAALAWGNVDERQAQTLRLFATLPFFVINACMMVWAWCIYIRDVGMVGERVKALIGLGLFLGLIALATGAILQAY